MKNIVFNDAVKRKDVDDSLDIKKQGQVKGFVSIKDLDGNTLYESENKVVVSGSAFTAGKHFNINPKAYTPSYNEVLGLEHSVVEPVANGPRKDELVFLFAVGTGGCATASNIPKPVRYDSWITPEEIVPFKYVSYDNDLNGDDRNKYFGRKVIESEKRIAYYFKAFESEPVFKQQYLDGTPIDENVYLNDDRSDEIESFVTLKLEVSLDDCKEFFAYTGIEDPSLSTLSILTAWKKEIDGITYFQDIRPLTKYNFPNESLISEEKGLSITYILYY